MSGEKFQVITANRTDDGYVVYLAADRSWTTSFQDALVFDSGATDSGESLDGLLAWAGLQQRDVCDPYFFAVERGDDGALGTLSARERIRAAGPEATLRVWGYA